MKRKTKSIGAQEALSRATSSITASNYPAIYAGLMAKGIAELDIKPRENVFTFNAWRALGRTVRRGEHGVKVRTVLVTSREKVDAATGEKTVKAMSRPWMATVFHISQTDELRAAPLDQKPAATIMARLDQPMGQVETSGGQPMAVPVLGRYQTEDVPVAVSRVPSVPSVSEPVRCAAVARMNFFRSRMAH